MGSKKSYLKIINNTNFQMNITTSDTDSFDWDGSSRPDKNFNNVTISAHSSLEHREEVNSNSNGCWFTMSISLSDGGEVTIRNDQLDAFKHKDRTYSTQFNNGKKYTVYQYHEGSRTNIFTITDRAFPLSRWMKDIPDSKNLTTISIPGTHETLATKGGASGFAKCQNWDVSKQLDYGVRYFDIRMKASHKYPYLQGYHGDSSFGVEEPYSFPEVLEKIDRFLKKNKTESVLLQLKQERSGWSDYDFARLVFREFVKNPKYQHLFHVGEALPNLGDCRGKIVLINRFVNDAGYGYNVRPWGDNNIFHKSPQHPGTDRTITATYLNTANQCRYFFSGKEYCKISQKTKKTVFDWHSVPKYWKGLSKPITGVLEKITSSTDSNDLYFFSGTEFCLYEWNKGIASPGWRPTSGKWNGVDKPIDGAFKYPDNDTHYYFFSGDLFCKYNNQKNEIEDHWEKTKSKWEGPELVIGPHPWSEYKQQSYYVQDVYDPDGVKATIGHYRDEKMRSVNTFFRDSKKHDGSLQLCFCSASKFPVASPEGYAAGGDGINERTLNQHLKKHNWKGGVILFDFIDSYWETIVQIFENN